MHPAVPMSRVAARALLALALVASAAALPGFRSRIPNGFASDNPNSGITCEHLGHNNCVAGAPRNQFGEDFEAAGLRWTAELCKKDSDGDGLTNGQELGDPCCQWTPENPDPPGFRSTGLSHPGVASEVASNPATCPSTTTTTAATTTAGSSSAATTARIRLTTTATTVAGAGADADADPSPTDDDGVCFPGSSLVTLASGASLRLDALQVGDEVVVAPGGRTSRVFMFTHKLAGVSAEFMRVSFATQPPRADLVLTPGHYVPVPGRGLVRAADLRTGDVLIAADGASLPVRALARETRAEGLYNPQTLHGDIVVDGVVVSTYTQAIPPPFAHALLAPLRALFVRLGLSTSAFDAGAPAVVNAVAAPRCDVV